MLQIITQPSPVSSLQSLPLTSIQIFRLQKVELTPVVHRQITVRFKSKSRIDYVTV